MVTDALAEVVDVAAHGADEHAAGCRRLRNCSPAVGNNGSRISIASRKISPAMMRPLMKYSPDW